MFYKPEIGVAADVIPYYENDEFKLLYLHDYRNVEEYGEGCHWNLLTTKDFITYENFNKIIERGEKEEQDLYVYTGCVIKKEGLYFVFYTGHNPHLREQGLPEQKILLATGTDLVNLKKVKEFVFEAPDYLDMHDFRDPFVYFDECSGEYKMLLAARTKEGPIKHRGVTMRAHSRDLYQWDLEKVPFYAPNAYYAHECPDYFRMGDWYYLIFSEFTDKFVTRYRYSQNPEGPWLTPKNDAFDNHAFYAAKSISDGTRRYLFGWNPTRNENTDYGFWQWGGNIIPQELYQNADGTLSVKIPNQINEFYNNKVPLDVFNISEMSENSGEINADGNIFGYTLFNEIPHSCKLKLSFSIQGTCHDFGVALHADDGFNQGYLVKFEPELNRVILDKVDRRDPSIFGMMDTERYIPFAESIEHRLVIIIDGNIAVLYFDEKYSMNLRLYDITNKRFGVYSNHSDVVFKEICCFEGKANE